MYNLNNFQSKIFTCKLNFIFKCLFVLIVLCNISIISASDYDDEPEIENICENVEIDGTTNLTKYEHTLNCPTLFGNVIISKINGIALKNISFATKDINGYLVVYHTQNLETLKDLFPNLILIRGKQLFNKYSLVIYENMDLKNIGLKNLVAINKGSVRIENNPSLCYVNTINWIEILKNASEQNFILKRNRDSFFCPACKKSNKIFGYNTRQCWDYDVYQKVCSNCATREKCKIDCCYHDAGCRGLCSNYQVHSDGRCVNHCKEVTEIFEYNNICYGKEICSNLGLIPFLGNCSEECPENYEFKIDQCVKCPGNCYKECSGQIVIHKLKDAKALHKCTHLEGSIIFELKDKTSKIMDQLKKYVSSIEVITEYLVITKSPQLTTFNIFKSLKKIMGQKLYEKKYSLYVTENDNVEFMFRKNITIEKGSVYFHMNPKFCVQRLESLIIEDENYTVIASPHSNGINLKGFCADKYRTHLRVVVENKNSTAALLLVDPRWLTHLQKRIFLGYEYYFMATEKNVSIEGNHGCGRDDWKLEVDLSKQVRHIISNLKPNTRYAYYVKTLVILDYALRKYATSPVQYFRTLQNEPKPITKVFYNLINGTHLDIFWWPPSDIHTHNHTQYQVIWGEIDEYRSTEMNIKHNGTCVRPKKEEWRGLNPFHKDFYDRESLDFEHEMPNKIFFLAPILFPNQLNETVIKIDHEIMDLNVTDVEVEIERIVDSSTTTTRRPTTPKTTTTTKAPIDPDFVDPTDDDEDDGADAIYKSMDSQYYMFNALNTSWYEFGWQDGPDKYEIILPQKNMTHDIANLCSGVNFLANERCQITDVPNLRISDFETDHWIIKVMVRSCDSSFIHICSKPIYFELKKPFTNDKSVFYL